MECSSENSHELMIPKARYNKIVGLLVMKIFCWNRQAELFYQYQSWLNQLKRLLFCFLIFCSILSKCCTFFLLMVSIFMQVLMTAIYVQFIETIYTFIYFSFCIKNCWGMYAKYHTENLAILTNRICTTFHISLESSLIAYVMKHLCKKYINHHTR